MTTANTVQLSTPRQLMDATRQPIVSGELRYFKLPVARGVNLTFWHHVEEDLWLVSGRKGDEVWCALADADRPVAETVDAIMGGTYWHTQYADLAALTRSDDYSGVACVLPRRCTHVWLDAPTFNVQWRRHRSSTEEGARCAYEAPTLAAALRTFNRPALAWEPKPPPIPHQVADPRWDTVEIVENATGRVLRTRDWAGERVGS